MKLRMKIITVEIVEINYMKGNRRLEGKCKYLRIFDEKCYDE